MVAIQLSYWGGLFSGAMLVSGRASILLLESMKKNIKKNTVSNGLPTLGFNLFLEYLKALFHCLVGKKNIVSMGNPYEKQPISEVSS